MNHLGVCLQVSVLPVFTLRQRGKESQVKYTDSTASRESSTHLSQAGKLSCPKYTGPPSHRELECRTTRATERCWQQEAGKEPTHRSELRQDPPGPRQPFLVSAHRGPWGGGRPSLRMSQIQEGQDPSPPKYRPPRWDPHFVRWAETPSSPSNTYICICL